MADREARYGLNLYRVYVSEASNVASLWVNVSADSLTVTPGGALILAVEVEPIENLEETPDGDLRRKENAAGIDVPPVAVFAPGHWHAAIMIDHETHSPSFLEDD
jgi:hypothetical protein